MPKVSVIMSVFNGEKYLKEAIGSILNQTFRDFEFIIVNDGSTDNTPNILREYAKKDKRIKIITNQKNIGLTKSLNKAIKGARGEYVARMDADDISLPERLEKQVKFFRKRLNVGVLGTQVKIIDKNGNVTKNVRFPKNNLKNYLKKRNFLVHGTLMMRKKVLDRVGDYDEEMEMAQDYELVLRISKITDIDYLRENLYLLRRHKGALSFRKVFSQIKYTSLAKKKFFGWQGIWGTLFYLKDLIYTFFVTYKLGIPSVLKYLISSL